MRTALKETLHDSVSKRATYLIPKEICASSSPPLSNPAPASLFLPSLSLVQQRGHVCLLLPEPGAGQRAQQEDAEGGRAEHHRQGDHQLQRRLRAGLQAARPGETWSLGRWGIAEMFGLRKYRQQQQPGGLMKSRGIHLTPWYHLSSSNLSILVKYEDEDGTQDNLMPRSQWCYSEECAYTDLCWSFVVIAHFLFFFFCFLFFA